ncbi:MAG: hypothetical protein GY810_22960 [Aureispira sp.]|nr:hypothetical protein [Aureispira sp.]
MRISLIIGLICYLAASISAQTKDSLLFQTFKGYKVYQNLETGLLHIAQNGIVKRKNLNYVGRLNGHGADYLQILDSKNNAYILNDNFQKVDAPTFYGLCGTVPHYELKIIERGDYFVIMEDETFYDNENKIPAIDSILKEGITDIYFPNKTKVVHYTSNDFYDNHTPIFFKTILIEKNGKTGIVKADKTVDFYDEVVSQGNLLKVKNKKGWGYYTITKSTKYKNLEPFNYTLAQFELKNGETGYIDTKGNEYYKR